MPMYTSLYIWSRIVVVFFLLISASICWIIHFFPYRMMVFFSTLLNPHLIRSEIKQLELSNLMSTCHQNRRRLI